MIKVLIVDDHPLLRTGAAGYLSQAEDISVMGEADNAVDALELIRQSSPDVVLLDIRLKGDTNGISLARDIRETSPSTQILILTNYTHEPYVKAAMEIGAKGYIVKDTPPAEILEAIRMVAHGRTVFSSGVTDKLVAGYLGSTSSGSGRYPESLTSREQEIIQLLAEGHSNGAIAERLALSVKAVQLHLTNVYGKLGVRSRSQAIVQALKLGIVVLDADEYSP